MATVEKGDVITTDVTGHSTVIDVKWRQTLKDHQVQYYQGKYTNTTKGNESNLIFVQKDMLEKFNGLAKDSKITVNDEFQYGQKDKSGANRWLVYHNKDDKPYQHRFVEGVLIKYGDQAGEVLHKLGLKTAEGISTIMQTVITLFGNYLHNW